jgi:hypothetical protein
MLNKQNVTSFFFTKTENRKAKQVLSGGCVLVVRKDVKDVRNGDRRVNMVEIFHTHVCKCKNETC